MDNIELAHKLCEKLWDNPTKTDEEIEEFLTTLKLLKYYKHDVVVSDLFLVLKDGKHLPMR